MGRKHFRDGAWPALLISLNPLEESDIRVRVVPGFVHILQTQEVRFAIRVIVNGTRVSELRTRFCPARFTYSVTTGSSISLDERSTSCANCLPSAISFSNE